MNSNKYLPLLQLVIRGTLLIIAAFIINYLAYYLWELLRSSQLPYIHKYAFMGGLGAAWAIINLFLIIAVITKRFWSDPDLFTFLKK